MDKSQEQDVFVKHYALASNKVRKSYFEWLYFRGVIIFVVFLEGQFCEFYYQLNSNYL